MPNERLVTDWLDWRGDDSRGSTRVAWILERVSENQTRLTLIHGGFSRVADFGDSPFGWGQFAEMFKKEVEGRAPRRRSSLPRHADCIVNR